MTARKFDDATAPADENARTLESNDINANQDNDKVDGNRDKDGLTEDGKAANDDGTGFIVYREQVVRPNGKVETEEHGPMLVSEWAKYSKEKGL